MQSLRFPEPDPSEVPLDLLMHPQRFVAWMKMTGSPSDSGDEGAADEIVFRLVVPSEEESEKGAEEEDKKDWEEVGPRITGVTLQGAAYDYDR